MKYILLFFLIFFNSCIVTPKYYLHTNKNLSDFKLQEQHKFVLIKNNFPVNFDQFSKRVNDDFTSIINEIKISHHFLELNTENFFYHLNTEQLKIIKQESNSDFLILVQTLKKNSSKENKREFHVVIQLIDLNNENILYSKEAISEIKLTDDYSTISESEKGQLLKTYEKVFKDFKEEINSQRKLN